MDLLHVKYFQNVPAFKGTGARHVILNETKFEQCSARSARTSVKSDQRATLFAILYSRVSLMVIEADLELQCLHLENE